MRSVALVLCTLTTLLVLSFSAAAAPAAQAAGPRIDRGERAVIRAINGARAAHGLRRMRAHRRLARAADVHTRSMLRADYFSHGAFSQRVRRYVRFRRIGETIAMTSRCSARRAVRMWLNSPGHRAVLLSRGFRRVGVGRRKGRLGASRACLYTADFASRR
jgi:uncharacterized protein YkwD